MPNWCKKDIFIYLPPFLLVIRTYKTETDQPQEEEDFELNTLWNWEPVEVLEDRSDVITGVEVGEQT